MVCQKLSCLGGHSWGRSKPYLDLFFGVTRDRVKAGYCLVLKRRTVYLHRRVPRGSHKPYMPVCKELPEVQLHYQDKPVNWRETYSGGAP